MKTISRIRRFIVNIDKNEMFTTRQLLSFGERNAVDQATYRLVKDGIIIRVAYGVFVITGSDLSRITPESIAMVKAKAFKRKIVEHASAVGKRLGIGGQASKGPTFATRARTSSFLLLTTGTRIYFKGVSAKKFKLSGSFLGDILRSLWNLTERGCKSKALTAANMIMKRSHRAQLPDFADLIPEWLHAHFAFAWR